MTKKGAPRKPLVALEYYIQLLARVSEDMEIELLDPVTVSAPDAETDPDAEISEAVDGTKVLLDADKLERLAKIAAQGGVVKVAPRTELNAQQIIERLELLISKQFDVRTLHEKTGVASFWAKMSKRVEIKEPLGKMLAVMQAARPNLFLQQLLGGYLAAVMGWKLELSEEECAHIFTAGVLRDLGMLYVEPRILDDPTDQHFTGDDWIEVQTHVVVSHKIVRFCELHDRICETVLCHHERYDNTGYPRALYGDEVPIYAQLLGFADIVAALRIKRFYGSGRNLKDTLTVLRLNTDGFSPVISEVFEKLLEESGMRASGFCPHDEYTMLTILKRRANLIRNSMLQLIEVSEDRRTRNKPTQGHLLRSSIDRMLTNIRQSGHGEPDFLWWLGLLAAGKEKVEPQQLAEIDLQQTELLWQLRRIRQDLFKAVPALGYRQTNVAI